MVRQRTMWRVTPASLLALVMLTACSTVAGNPVPSPSVDSPIVDAVRAVTVTAEFDGTSQTITATTAQGAFLGQQSAITVPRVFEVYGVWSGTTDGASDTSSELQQVGVLEPARSTTVTTSTTFASSTASAFLYFYIAPRYRPEGRTTMDFQLSLTGSG